MMINWIKNKINTRVNIWIQKRIPPQHEVKLGQRQLFIFVSRSGWIFTVILLLMMIGATNYQNSLTFFISFFLMAVGLLNIFTTFSNLSGLTIKGLTSEPVFVGEPACFKVLVESLKGCQSLGMGYGRAVQCWYDFYPSQNKTIELKFITQHRGWNNPGRIYLKSDYPMGLLKCWSYVDLDQKVLVFPKPLEPQIEPQLISEDEGEKTTVVMPGENFQESRRYQPGDPLPHIDWRVYARTDELYTKRFEQIQGAEDWVDWDAFEGVEKELRLSYLCHQLLQREQQQINYGLRMPSIKISPSMGNTHLQKCLGLLAVH